MELLDDTIDMWFENQLLNPEFPMSMDVFISGFGNPVRDALLERMRAARNHLLRHQLLWRFPQAIHAQGATDIVHNQDFRFRVSAAADSGILRV